MTTALFEKTILKFRIPFGVDGPLRLDEGVWKHFAEAPIDVLPEFKGPPGYKWTNARGKDHPRYGRFVYALAKHVKPEWVVEVGTDTGGTAVGWARALKENGRGRLVCVDMDAYSTNTYPRSVRANLAQVGLAEDSFQLRAGNSLELIPALAKELPGKIDIYLVDGDHRYEGALADMENGLPMMRPGGFILVHDIDRGRPMNESTPEHPFPVYQAFRDFAARHHFQWCELTFIRKHLGVIKIV